MAILSKEAYEGKKNYAINKAHDNIEIAMENGATEGQAKAIARLCADRHFLHSNWDSMFNDSSSDAGEANKMLIDDGSIHASGEPICINAYLSKSGLEQISILNKFEDIPTLETYEYDGLTEEEAYDEFTGYLDEVDKAIIEYLNNFDKKYLTNFAPSLNARCGDIGGLF